MACDECGAKRGHMSGCSKGVGNTTGRRKGGNRGLGTGKKGRKCFACDGTGTIKNPSNPKEERVCSSCGGTGEKP